LGASARSYSAACMTGAAATISDETWSANRPKLRVNISTRARACASKARLSAQVWRGSRIM
jgi:hypothetical protein